MADATEQRPRGLRKYIREPERFDAKYGTFAGPTFRDRLTPDGYEREFRRLTERDVEILALIYRYRHVQFEHAAALLGPHENGAAGGFRRQLRHRLAGLFHHGYLARYPLPRRMRGDLAEHKGSFPMVYGLDRRGWEHLEYVRRREAGEGSEDFDPVKWKKAYTRRMEDFLEHALMRTDFRATLELALRDQDGLELWEWDQSQECWGSVTVAGKTLRVAPDGYFSIADQAGLKHCFLEVDRGTEEQSRIRAKFRNYWWYLQSPAYLEAHDDPKRVRVLFVTTSARRLENMMTTLREMEKPNNPPFGGKGMFWFCLQEDYQLAEPASIFEPIWRTIAAPDERKSLA